MREILFKGKRKRTGKWVEGTAILFDSIKNTWLLRDKEYRPIEFGETYYSIDPETVGQYTGLTDKNGKKIFEGDICKYRSNYSGGFIISVVTYTDGCFLDMADENSGFNLSDKLEVIGNIHDNPELLEGGI